MKTKPKFFTYMPFVFGALALSFPLQIAAIYRLSPWEVEAVFSKLTPLNFILMAVFAWSAWAVKTYNRNIFLALPFINLAVFANNYFVGTYGGDFNVFETTLASSAFLGLSLTFYGKSVYRVINDAGSRWWQTKPRSKVSLPLTIHTANDTVRTKSFDVSQTGVFAVNDPQLELFQTSRDQEIEVDFHLEDNVYRCRGKIVRKALPKGIYPEGVGIHFSQMDEKLNEWLENRAAA